MAAAPSGARLETFRRSHGHRHSAVNDDGATARDYNMPGSIATWTARRKVVGYRPSIFTLAADVAGGLAPFRK